MMNSKERAFIGSLIKIDQEKQQKTLEDELKELYRVSIKMGPKTRADFIERARSNSILISEMDIESICVSLGRGAFPFTKMLAEYIDFNDWLEKMTGQNFRSEN